MRRAGLSTWSGGMICLPNRKRALAVSSIRDRVRKRIGAPFTIMTSPWRSSRTRLDIVSLFTNDPAFRGPPCSGRARRSVEDILAGPGGRTGQEYPPLLEQAEERLRGLVRHGQCLGAQLLADLERCQLSGLLGQIGVDKRAETAVQRVDLIVVVGNLVVHIVDRAAEAVQLRANAVLPLDEGTSRSNKRCRGIGGCSDRRLGQ